MTPNMERFTRKIAVVGLVLALPFVAAPTPMSLTVPEYPGSSEREGREGTIDIFSLEHRVALSFEPATGLPNGPRQHFPLTVVQVIDKSTPGFHNAFASGQVLTEVTLDFYRINPETRDEAKYYTITLEYARIVSLETFMPTSFLPENEPYRHMVRVQFVYQEIKWHWLPDDTFATDTWGE